MTQTSGVYLIKTHFHLITIEGPTLEESHYVAM